MDLHTHVECHVIPARRRWSSYDVPGGATEPDIRLIALIVEDDTDFYNTLRHRASSV